MTNRVFVTGAAGFIGYHLAKLLVEEGFEVHGYDGLTDYYDVSLKQARLALLAKYTSFSFTQAMLEDSFTLEHTVSEFAPEIIVHLAAQAGVRYSLENPHAYVQSNVVGTMNILEAARQNSVSHLLMASTSSVYGANTVMPFNEVQKADTQLTIYAATKKANENMSHAYSHLWDIPTTMIRFFTVYGPWGRPDMALFKFVDGILDGRPIDIYNRGDMKRDFTYINDLVKAIRLLMDIVPPTPKLAEKSGVAGDSLSPRAPWRVVNIGNSNKVSLLDFLNEIEAYLEVKAQRNLMPMQAGDVSATWADSSLLRELTGFSPSIPVRHGIAEFIDWFRSYYRK